MAVVAIHAKIARMELVAVGHRLFGGVAGFYVRRRGEIGEARNAQYRANAEQDTAIDRPIIATRIVDVECSQ